MCPLAADAGSALNPEWRFHMSRLAYSAVILIALTFTMPQSAQARQPKKYQVTGNVLEITADFIAVDKDGERWEIGRDSSTKITGTPKVGSKVTVEYQMSASKIEAKPDAKSK
jgi:hypothetical protein